MPDTLPVTVSFIKIYLLVNLINWLKLDVLAFRMSLVLYTRVNCQDTVVICTICLQTQYCNQVTQI